jgi:hypothetical protein
MEQKDNEKEARAFFLAPAYLKSIKICENTVAYFTTKSKVFIILTHGTEQKDNEKEARSFFLCSSLTHKL